MKYYVTRANITKEGTEEKDIKSYETYDSALKYYHTIFHNGVLANKKVSAQLTDENLNVVMKEVWVSSEEEETE